MLWTGARLTRSAEDPRAAFISGPLTAPAAGAAGAAARPKLPESDDEEQAVTRNPAQPHVAMTAITRAAGEKKEWLMPL